jgi:hypothetical protein
MCLILRYLFRHLILFLPIFFITIPAKQAALAEKYGEKSFHPRISSLHATTNNTPLDIQIRGRQDPNGFKVETCIKNKVKKSLSGVMRWELRPRGRVEIPPVAFQNLLPDEQLTTTSGLMAGNREARLAAIVDLEKEGSFENSIGLMPMSLRLTSPKIDGCLTEWIDVPTLYLNKESQVVKKGAGGGWSEDDTSGIFQFWWTDEAFYIATQWTDKASLLSPPGHPESGNADSLEIFLGLGGPTTRTSLGNGDYQICIKCDGDRSTPEMWICGYKKRRKAGRIASTKTTTGRIIEAEILLRELGGWKPKRQTMIGFDLVLHEGGYDDSGKGAFTLKWSGASEVESDPSRWGLAIIY